jgi:uncharacterized protein
VFVMGANRWRTADRWPFPGTKPDTLYLAGQQGSGNEGRLIRSPLSSPPSLGARLRSDPAHPVADPFNGQFGAHDYRALTPAGRVAVFETAPFKKPLEIIGGVVVELAASATVPDFDLWAQLYDVEPDGTAWNLSSPGTALQRASFRVGGPDRRLVKPGETIRLRMERLVTANRFLPGHRLRVVITPQFYPLFSVNPQTGSQEFDSDSVRVGEIRIERGSMIVLPRLGGER